MIGTLQVLLGIAAVIAAVGFAGLLLGIGNWWRKGTVK